MVTLSYTELLQHLRGAQNSPEVARLLEQFELQYKSPLHWIKNRPNAILRANKGLMVKMYNERGKV